MEKSQSNTFKISCKNKPVKTAGNEYKHENYSRPYPENTNTTSALPTAGKKAVYIT